MRAASYKARDHTQSWQVA